MLEGLRRHLTYSADQRRVLTVLLCILLGWLAIRLIVHRTFIDDPQPVQGDRAADVADKLDPNTADWTELSALPGIGEKRARAIVARRDELKKRRPDAIVYRTPRDLFYVEGFGPAMVEQLKPYLIFPTTNPTTFP